MADLLLAPPLEWPLSCDPPFLKQENIIYSIGYCYFLRQCIRLRCDRTVAFFDLNRDGSLLVAGCWLLAPATLTVCVV